MVNANLEIENANIGRGRYRNFSGEKSAFNPTGKRTFTVILDEATGHELEDAGWHIRWRQPQDDQEDILALLQVEVRFGDYPPKIMLISGKDRSFLNEDTISLLDSADIAKADLVIRPYNWDVNGKQGTKAYVKAMYVTLEDDDFGGRYSNHEDDPF